eukprot:29941-Rhodomonas_salina.2
MRICPAKLAGQAVSVASLPKTGFSTERQAGRARSDEEPDDIPRNDGSFARGRRVVPKLRKHNWLESSTGMEEIDGTDTGKVASKTSHMRDGIAKLQRLVPWPQCARADQQRAKCMERKRVGNFAFTRRHYCWRMLTTLRAQHDVADPAGTGDDSARTMSIYQGTATPVHRNSLWPCSACPRILTWWLTSGQCVVAIENGNDRQGD